MTRGNARELAVHLLYSREFTDEEPADIMKNRLNKEYYGLLKGENPVYSDAPSSTQIAYLERVVSGTANETQALDSKIQKYSISWDVSRISKLTRCIMRLAMFEILYMDDIPTGVAINEAVRIAKLYDGDDTGAFVNGILGAFARDLPAGE